MRGRRNRNDRRDEEIHEAERRTEYGAERREARHTEYEEWRNVYGNHLMRYYNIFGDSIRTIKKTKDIKETGHNNISYEDFCIITYYCSSGYISPYA